MSPRDWKERIRDILEAIGEIQTFTHEMDFGGFRADAKTLKAVELDLIVIGEAANQVPDHVQEQNPQIPWTLMRAMRNRLVHVHFSVDAGLLWDTIRIDLPEIEAALKSILK